MSSLAHCFKKLKISPEEQEVIGKSAKSYLLEGFPGQEANSNTVNDIITDLEDDIKDIEGQVSASQARMELEDFVENTSVPEIAESIVRGILYPIETDNNADVAESVQKIKREFEKNPELFSKAVRLAYDFSGMNAKNPSEKDYATVREVESIENSPEEYKAFMLAGDLIGTAKLLKRGEYLHQWENTAAWDEVSPESAAPPPTLEPPLAQDDKIGSITRAELGARIAKGDSSVVDDIRAGIEEHGPSKIQDAVRNQMVAEVAKAPKGEARKAVRNNIAQVEGAINDALTGKEPAPAEEPKAKAPADGTVEAANERLVEDADVPAETLAFKAVDTNSRNFKRWFGKGKVVDADGKPSRVFHGTSEEISGFSKDRIGKHDSGYAGSGIYLTPKPAVSNIYASKTVEGGRTYPAYVSLQKPFDLDSDKEFNPYSWIPTKTKEIQETGIPWAEARELAAKEWTKQAIEDGYDGALGSDEIVVFEPSNIKSAISNTGEFSKKNDRIDDGKEVTSETGRAFILEDLVEGLVRAGKSLRDTVQSLKKTLGKAYEKIKDLVKPMYNHMVRMAKDEGGFIAGPGAVGADIAKLDVAKSLLAKGKMSPRNIRKNTGWRKGKDDVWRFEISDRDMDWGESLIFSWNQSPKPKESIPQFLASSNDYNFIGDIIRHKKLFEAYPKTRNLRLVANKQLDADASYRHNAKEIHYNPEKVVTTSGLKKSILHELQHAGQRYEKMSPGMNTSEIDTGYEKKILKIEKLKDEYKKDYAKYQDELYAAARERRELTDEARNLFDKVMSDYDVIAELQEDVDATFEEYQKNLGEAEARNTEDRMDMPDWELAGSEPYTGIDFIEADLIVHPYDEGGMIAPSSMPSKPEPPPGKPKKPTTSKPKKPPKPALTIKDLKAFVADPDNTVVKKQQQIKNFLARQDSDLVKKALTQLNYANRVVTKAAKERAIKKAVDILEKKVEKHLKQTGAKNIKETFKKARLKKMDRDVRRVWKQLEDYSKLKEDEVEARLGGLPEDAVYEATMIKLFGDLKSASGRKLQLAQKELDALAKDSKVLMKAEIAKRKQVIDERNAEAVKRLRGRRVPTKKGIISNVKRNVNSLLNKNESWEFILDGLDRYDKSTGTLKGWFAQTFGRLAHRATVKQEIGLKAQREELRAASEKIYGKKADAVMTKKGNTFHNVKVFNHKDFEKNFVIRPEKYPDVRKTWKEAHPGEDFPGNKAVWEAAQGDRIIVSQSQAEDIQAQEETIELTVNQAIHRVMFWQNEKARGQLERLGFTEDSIKKLNSLLDSKDKAWADWLFGYFDRYYDSINDTYEKLNFVPLDKVDFYVPTEAIADDDPLDLLQERAKKLFSSMTKGSLRARVPHNYDFKWTDINQALASHVIQMEHYKAWAEPVTALKSTFGSARVKSMLDKYHPGVQPVVSNFIQSFVENGLRQGKSHMLLDNARMSFVLMKLGMNSVVFLKQLMSTSAYAVELPAGEWAKGFARLMSNPVRMKSRIKDMWDNSPHTQTRWEKGSERDMYALMNKLGKKRITGTTNVAGKLMALTRAGDITAVMLGGWPVYDYHYRKHKAAGKSTADAKRLAVEEFEMSTDRAQQASSPKDLSIYQKGGSVDQLFTMFMTTTRSYWSNEFGAVRNMLQGRGKFTDNFRRFAMFHLVMPMLYQFAASGFQWDDDEMKRAAALGSFNGIFIVRDLMEMIVDKYFLERLNNDMLKSPVGDIVTDVMFATKKFTSEDGITLEDMSYILPGLRSLLGAIEYSKGETDDARRIMGYTERNLDTMDNKYRRSARKIRRKIAQGKTVPHHLKKSLTRITKITTQINKAEKAKRMERVKALRARRHDLQKQLLEAIQ